MPPSAEPLRLYLLGRFRLERDGAPIVLPRRKLERLLAYLALHPQPHARELLAARFWGDDSDASARSSLRNALPILRKRLGHDLLLIDRETVQVNPAFPLWVDACEFMAQAPGGASSQADRSEIDLLNSKIDLYHGELLADYYEDWILPERERLRARWIEHLLRLAQLWRAQSEYARASETARRVLSADPANEPAHQNLMVCYLALGERSLALKQFEACRRALREDLGVEPSAETLALVQAVQRAAAPRPAPAAQLTNLPVPLSSFIGRRGEVATLKAMLGQTRLLTIAGAGGCGKTRLAMEVAHAWIDRVRDGVWWVDLAPLSNSDLVPQLVAKALGVRETAAQPLLETLAQQLATKQLLLVLDNCEHLVAACAQLAEHLLRACPQLTILATSRQVLGVNGGIVWHAPSLSLPPPVTSARSPALVSPASSEAIQLFVARAAAVQPTFNLSERNIHAITQICRQLDGIPLALELAAARLNVLSPDQLARRLDQRFDLLTSGNRAALPRHQTLRAAVDWSHDLLAEDERVLFRRLAVFRGSFTLEAAQTVAGADDSAGADGRTAPGLLGPLAQLVDKSLALVEHQYAPPRYRLLETIREYAWEKLAQAGEGDDARHRHLAYFTQRVEQVDREVDAAAGASWSDLEAEADNIRAALDWARASGAIETGLRLCGSVVLAWEAWGDQREGTQWFDSLLELDAPVAPEVRRKALSGAGVLALRLGDYERANRRLDASLSLARELGDPQWVAVILNTMGIVCDLTGDYDRAATYWQESLAIHRQREAKLAVAIELDNLGQLALRVGDYPRAAALLEKCLDLVQGAASYTRALALFNRGDLEHALGHPDPARELYQQSLALFQAMGSPWWCAVVRLYLGQLDLEAGDYAGGVRAIQESLEVHGKAGDRVYIAECVEALAEAALGAPQRDRTLSARHSGRLFGAAAALREQIGAPLPPYKLDRHRRALDALRAALGEAVLAQVQAEGCALAAGPGLSLALVQAIEAAVNG